MNEKRLPQRLVAGVLALFYLDLFGLASSLSYAIFFVLVPWLLAFLVVLGLALRKKDGRRDWVTLTILASIPPYMLQSLVLGSEHGSGAPAAPSAISQWARLTSHFVSLWLPALVAGAIAVVIRSRSPRFACASRPQRRLNWLVAGAGALGFPAAPASLLAVAHDKQAGVLLYAVSVLSLALFGAALRGPEVTSQPFIRRTLGIGGVALSVVVGIASLSMPAAPSANAVWALFGLRHLGGPILALGVAWVSAALLGKRAADRAPAVHFPE